MCMLSQYVVILLLPVQLGHLILYFFDPEYLDISVNILPRHDKTNGKEPSQRDCLKGFLLMFMLLISLVDILYVMKTCEN